MEGIGDQKREELADLLVDKIENLRPKLLDCQAGLIQTIN